MKTLDQMTPQELRDLADLKEKESAKKQDAVSEICCDFWNPDDPISLKELLQKIKQIQKCYGVDSVLRLDAGYNNISLLIKPSRSVN